PRGSLPTWPAPDSRRCKSGCWPWCRSFRSLALLLRSFGRTGLLSGSAGLTFCHCLLAVGSGGFLLDAYQFGGTLNDMHSRLANSRAQKRFSSKSAAFFALFATHATALHGIETGIVQ